MTRRLFTGVCLILSCLALGAAAFREAEYAKGYFGDLLPDLTAAQLQSAANGSKLFLKRWEAGAGRRRNADSCVSCHSVPMPGGSGMSAQALVAVDAAATPGSLPEVVQTGFPAISPHGAQTVRRTRALFGIGYLEFAKGAQRFGAFGSEPSLKAFVARTFATELGVSSSLQCARRDGEKSYPSSCAAAISDKDLDDVVAYLRALAPPPRAPERPEGRRVFEAAGCASCHVPTMTTRADAPPPLQGRRFAAYTDRRVHDMGARAKVMTAPLWGVQSFGPPYMHDACGGSLVAAIACHRGEAQPAADAFNALPAPDREALLAFLRGL